MLLINVLLLSETHNELPIMYSDPCIYLVFPFWFLQRSPARPHTLHCHEAH